MKNIRFSAEEYLSASKLNALSDAIQSCAPSAGDMTTTPHGAYPHKKRLFIESPIDWISRFRPEVYQENLYVMAGMLTRNGIDLEKINTKVTGIGNDIDGYAAIFSASTLYYVYLQLYNTDIHIDPSLAPNGVKIVCATSKPPAEGAWKNTYIPLCEFRTNPKKSVDPESIIRYWIKDIDDVVPMVDAMASVVFSQSEQHKKNSLGYDGTNNLEWEIYGFTNAATSEPDASALFPWRHQNDTPGQLLKEIRWCNAADLAEYLAGSIEQSVNHDNLIGAGDSTIHDPHIEDLLEDYIFDGNIGGVTMIFQNTSGTPSAGQIVAGGSEIKISKSAVSAIDANQNPTATQSVSSWLATIKAGDILRVFNPAYFNMHNGVTYGWLINQVDSVSDSGSYYTISCTNLASGGSLTGLLLFSCTAKGDTGITGATGSSYSNLRLEDGDAIGEKELWVTYTPAFGPPEDINLGSIYTLPPFPTANGQYVLEISNGAASWAGV